jgi:hypothetical protein
MSSQCLYMAEKRIKTAQVNLRIEPSLKAAAEKAASDDQRSLTSLIEKLLTDYLRKRGKVSK